MESKPIDVIPEDQAENGENAAGEKKTLEGMEFEIDESLLQVQRSDIEHDQELLQIQRRKSTPKVVVEEFVQVDSGDESDGSDGKQKKQEENKEGDILDDSQVNKRPHKVKTHIEIDDVSTRLFRILDQSFARRLLGIPSIIFWQGPLYSFLNHLCAHKLNLVSFAKSHKINQTPCIQIHSSAKPLCNIILQRYSYAIVQTNQLTPISIQFSQLKEGNAAQIGLHEISPLEKHYKNVSPGGSSGISDPSSDKDKGFDLNQVLSDKEKLGM